MSKYFQDIGEIIKKKYSLQYLPSTNNHHTHQQYKDHPNTTPDQANVISKVELKQAIDLTLWLTGEYRLPLLTSRVPGGITTHNIKITTSILQNYINNINSLKNIFSQNFIQTTTLSRSFSPPMFSCEKLNEMKNMEVMISLSRGALQTQCPNQPMGGAPFSCIYVKDRPNNDQPSLMSSRGEMDTSKQVISATCVPPFIN